MVKEFSINVKPQDEHNEFLILQNVLKELAKSGIKAKKDEISLVPLKKSIDARHGQVKFCLRYRVFIGEKPEDCQTNEIPVWKKAEEKAKKAFIITDNDKIYESIVNALPIIDFTGTTAFLLPHKFFIDKKYKSQCRNLIKDKIITMEYYFPNPEMSITLIGDFKL